MPTHQRYAVYHANDLFAMALPEASYWYEGRSRYYTYVANVEAPLAQVFALTNHIDHSWTRNPQVVWHATTALLRSTSVGDVIMSYDSGQVWLVGNLYETSAVISPYQRSWVERQLGGDPSRIAKVCQFYQVGTLDELSGQQTVDLVNRLFTQQAEERQRRALARGQWNSQPKARKAVAR